MWSIDKMRADFKEESDDRDLYSLHLETEGVGLRAHAELRDFVGPVAQIVIRDQVGREADIRELIQWLTIIADDLRDNG